MTSRVTAKPTATTADVQRAVNLIEEADAVLIAGGAGLSVPSGIDYANTEWFSRQFPGFAREHPEVQQMGSYWNLSFDQSIWADDRRAWCYLVGQCRHFCCDGADDPTYQNLRRLVEDKPSFVLTTNVDRMFVRNGWSSNNVYSMNGDQGLLQCGSSTKKGCGHVMDARPVWDALEPHINWETCRLADGVPAPTCPQCGLDALFPNTARGSFFISDHWQPNKRAYVQFMKSALADGKKLTVIEVGVGFSSPGAIRYPMEQLTASEENVSLIRVNLESPGMQLQVPRDRHVPLGMDIAAAMASLVQLRGKGPLQGATDIPEAAKKETFNAPRVGTGENDQKLVVKRSREAEKGLGKQSKRPATEKKTIKLAAHTFPPMEKDKPKQKPKYVFDYSRFANIDTDSDGS